MTRNLDIHTTTDMPLMLAYAMLFAAIMAVQVGVVNAAVAHPQAPVVFND